MNLCRIACSPTQRDAAERDVATQVDAMRRHVVRIYVCVHDCWLLQYYLPLLLHRFFLFVFLSVSCFLFLFFGEATPSDMMMPSADPGTFVRSFVFMRAREAKHGSEAYDMNKHIRTFLLQTHTQNKQPARLAINPTDPKNRHKRGFGQRRAGG